LLCIAVVPLVRAFGAAARGTSELSALLIALMILFPPAFVLSAVSPVVAKLQLHDLQHTGRVVGSLSAWATAGALVGTFGTGFVLVPLIPTSAAVFAIGGLLLAVALLLALRFGATSPAVAIACVACALSLAGAAMAIGSPCDAETDYHCAVIAESERPSGRTLILDDLRHSHVDLDDLSHLEFDYARWMGDAIDALPAGPLRAVYLGGGGYTLPRYVAAVRPGSRARVLEVDGELVELARRRLGLRTGSHLRVRVGDARVTLRDEPTDSADVVVGDAFGGRSLPWHLATAEFAREIRRVLRPGGLYALNLIDQGDLRLLRAEAATLLEVFADVRLVAHTENGELAGGNVVFLASDRALAPDVRSRSRGARTFDRPAVQRIAGDADVLRDDDAPADQLLSSR
ncbi:MAG TPA: fused MFS/spermidine synthase, partial [Solirubrobacteraceae bacterium]|nr:fused MFS/spermidine synthase [Solirubrobacteraceae bacterium]